MEIIGELLDSFTYPIASNNQQKAPPAKVASDGVGEFVNFRCLARFADAGIDRITLLA